MMRTKKQVMGMALALLLAAPVMLPQMETQAKDKPVMLNKETATLHVGDKLQLKLQGTKKKITWSTSSNAAASVSRKGMVTAKKAGKVTIRATVKTKSDSRKAYKCHIRIEEREQTDINVTGGFSCAGSVALTKELWAIFDKAVDGLTGVDYEPVAYLGSQVVAGTNHCGMEYIEMPLEVKI